jgi:hypothetical protein
VIIISPSRFLVSSGRSRTVLEEEVIALAFGGKESLASDAGVCRNVDEPASCAQGPLSLTLPYLQLI